MIAADCIKKKKKSSLAALKTKTFFWYYAVEVVYIRLLNIFLNFAQKSFQKLLNA